MPLEQVIGMLGQIATWVTVLFVFLTLREMEKQRKASQKPELIVPKVLVHGYFRNWSEFATLPIPNEWRNKEIKADEITLHALANITIYNIGFGAAKNLKLKWDFDTEKIMKDIKDYCYQNAIPIIVSVVENDFLKMEIDNSGIMTKFGAFSTQEHEYVMPASVPSSGLQSHLPLTYMNLLSILIYMINHSANKKASQLAQVTIEPPPLRLTMDYEDIGGSEYSKKYDVRFMILSMRITKEKSDVSDGEELVKGLFEFTEKP